MESTSAAKKKSKKGPSQVSVHIARASWESAELPRGWTSNGKQLCWWGWITSFFVISYLRHELLNCTHNVRNSPQDSTEIIQLKMYLFHSVRNLFKHRPENYFPFLCRWQTLTSPYHHVAVIFQDYELGISGVSWGCLQGSQQRSSDCRTRWVLGPGDFNHLLSSNARANFYDYEGQIRQVNE